GRRNVTPDTARNLTTAGVELPETAIKEQSGRREERNYVEAATQWDAGHPEGWNWRDVPKEAMQPVEGGNVPLGQFFYGIRENGRKVSLETVTALNKLSKLMPKLPETAIREKRARHMWTEGQYVAAALRWNAGHTKKWDWRKVPLRAVQSVDGVGDVPLGKFFYGIRTGARLVSGETRNALNALSNLMPKLPDTVIGEQSGRHMWSEENYVAAALRWNAGHTKKWDWRKVPLGAVQSVDGVDVPLGRFFYDIHMNGRLVSGETRNALNALSNLTLQLPDTVIREQSAQRRWSEEDYVKAAQQWSAGRLGGWKWEDMPRSFRQLTEGIGKDGVDVPLGRFFYDIRTGARRVSEETRNALNALNALSNLTLQLPETVIRERPGRRRWSEGEYVEAARQWSAGRLEGWNWEDVPQRFRQLTKGIGKDGEDVGDVPLGRFFYDIRTGARRVSEE
ncbi:hypothetical protein, partial [Streptomyces mirabilis]